MNKTDLIDRIALQADVPKAIASRTLEATLRLIEGALKNDESVTLVGFGTFIAGRRQARVGRNPRTGSSIRIESAKVPKFRPGKALKDALN